MSKKAATRPGVTESQVNRMINGCKKKGKAFFVHGNKRRKPTKAKSYATKAKVIELYKEKYKGSNII